MTTDEAREVLEKHKEWVLKFNHGMATAESKALEVAIAALEQPAPVYHYLPEMPEDERRVNGFNVTADGKTHSHICKCRFSIVDPTQREWFGTDGFAIVGIYAWCEIPPNPPVKEGGINGK